MTADIEVRTSRTEVMKRALHPRAHVRLAREALCLSAYGDSPNLPQRLGFDPETHTLTMERIRGRSLRDVFGINDEWSGTPTRWLVAKSYLERYVAAETDLLSRGLMYRGLDLDQVVFTPQKAVLLGHEHTLSSVSDGRWYFHGEHGVQEMMAPEELHETGYLSEKTAIYRTAALAHVILSGELPFPRFAQSSDALEWRRSMPLEISRNLSLKVGDVFRAGLNPRIIRRQENPQEFLEALRAAYEEN